MTARGFLRLLFISTLFSVLWVGCAVRVVAAAYVRWPSETPIVCIALGLAGFVVLYVVRGAGRGQE